MHEHSIRRAYCERSRCNRPTKISFGRNVVAVAAHRADHGSGSLLPGHGPVAITQRRSIGAA